MPNCRVAAGMSLIRRFNAGTGIHRRYATKKVYISCESLGNDKALKRRAISIASRRGGSEAGKLCKTDCLKLDTSGIEPSSVELRKGGMIITQSPDLIHRRLISHGGKSNSYNRLP